MAHISTGHPMSLIGLVAWLLLFDISSSVQPFTITALLPVSEIQPLLSSATREIATSRATLASTVANLGEIAASLESMKRGDDVKAIESVLDQAANSIRAAEDAQQQLSLFRKADRKEALEQSVQKLHFAIQDVDKYKQVFEQVDSKSKPYDDQLSKLVKYAYKDELKGDFERVYDDITNLKALLFVKYNSKKVEEKDELKISEINDKIDQGLASLGKGVAAVVKSDDQPPVVSGKVTPIPHGRFEPNNVRRNYKSFKAAQRRKRILSFAKRLVLTGAASSVIFGLGNLLSRIINPDIVQLPLIRSANPWFKFSTVQGQFESTPQFVYNRQVRQGELDTSGYSKIVVIGAAAAAAILVFIVAGLACCYLQADRKQKTSSSKNQDDSGSSKSASSSAFTETVGKTLGSKNS